MTVSVSLSVSPSAPASAGAVVTATYAVQGAPAAAQTLTFAGTVTFGGVAYPGATGSFTLPGAAPAESFAVPACPGLTFAKTTQANVFTATVPAAGTLSGKQVVTGSATVGGASLTATAMVTLPSVAPTPAPSSAVPYPAALATGHTLLNQYLPGDLYAWRFVPGTQTPVTNGSGITENPATPRNVSVTTDGGLSVLKLACTSAADCGIIQSPGTYPTSSGVVEALIKFSGFAYNGATVFADWASFWLYSADWPAGGEVDAVETSYGNSFVSYHYASTTSASSDTATTGPWAYTGKTVQLSPVNATSVPAAPNIVPDTWTYVTIAFGKNAATGNYYADVYYNGVLYCAMSGPWVTGKPMCVTAGTSYGGAILGSNQTPFDQPGSIEIQYVRVFS